MVPFSSHDHESAPDEAGPWLEAAEREFGMLPNLAHKMATAPALLEAYLTLGTIFDKTSFSPQERQVVLLAVGMKTLSNDTNHLANTPLDEAFAHRAWQNPRSST